MLTEKLIDDAIARGASDVHILPGSHPGFREKNGDIELVSTYPNVSASDIEGEVVRMLTEQGRLHLQRNRRHDSVLVLASGRRVRRHIFRQTNGLAIACRLVASEIRPYDSIGGPSVIQNITQNQTGLILLTGPSNSGKSTTLNTMVDDINRHQKRNIVTAEEPIEFVHTPIKSLISQREIGVDTPSYEDAIYDSLREDVNVLMLGELRDARAIRAAVAAADTGLLVVASLHSRNPPSAVQRVIDAFPANEQDLARSMLADSLRLIASQALVKTADDNDRVAAFETLVSTSAVRNLIRTGEMSQLNSVMQTGANHGMCTFKQSVDSLVAQGRITRATGELVLRGRGHDS
ncbi:type IV pilus twitching motility protein PilT [Trinickia mobilis]|uniref:type IV pilus twitching motility protein PilT n=1 Tax=Trinickia mobilis TaxID=2816356 RepID=UPI001A8CE2BC|nr:PilT/PilU family type 4a pilus ATPase [Trinickia mobilis]